MDTEQLLQVFIRPDHTESTKVTPAEILISTLNIKYHFTLQFESVF